MRSRGLTRVHFFLIKLTNPSFSTLPRLGLPRTGDLTPLGPVVLPTGIGGGPYLRNIKYQANHTGILYPGRDV